jgi:hypothetical protein
MSHPLSPFRGAALAAFAVAASLSSGCAVVTVAGTAASLAVSGVGLVADAAVGTVRLTGKAIGGAADAITPDSEP